MSLTHQVQLMLVVGTVSDARDAAAGIKSLVNHRRLTARLHLHVIVTSQLTRHIMQTLLDTWQLAQGPLNDSIGYAHLHCYVCSGITGR